MAFPVYIKATARGVSWLILYMVADKIWCWSWVAQKPDMTYGDKGQFFDRYCNPYLNNKSILFA